MRGSFLKALDLFDHVELGITATDAQHMAVATRKLIESVRPSRALLTDLY
jgi:hypothetical protein